MLHRFKISQDLLCSFCSREEKTPMHIFYSCNHIQILWERLKYYIQNNLDLPSITSQSAILGFAYSQSENFIIINHLMLILKYYIFKSRSNKHFSFLQLKTGIIKVKTVEKDLSKGDNNISKKFLAKYKQLTFFYLFDFLFNT